MDEVTVRLQLSIFIDFRSYDRAYGFVGPSIAFHAEWPPVMNFASNPSSRKAIAVLHPTWKP
jgi:hypothetical protein